MLDQPDDGRSGRPGRDPHYILDGHTPVPCPDLMLWAKWYEAASDDGSRIVGRFEHKGVEISTVFLGLDHSFGPGPPVLFETMIFGGADYQDQWRYTTWDEAEAGHMTICRKVRDALDAA